jgi:hypothetical protein
MRSKPGTWRNHGDFAPKMLDVAPKNDGKKHEKVGIEAGKQRCNMV